MKQPLSIEIVRNHIEMETILAELRLLHRWKTPTDSTFDKKITFCHLGLISADDGVYKYHTLCNKLPLMKNSAFGRNFNLIIGYQEGI